MDPLLRDAPRARRRLPIASITRYESLRFHLDNWIRDTVPLINGLVRLLTLPPRWCLRSLQRQWWKANETDFRRCVEQAGRNFSSPTFVKIGANDGLSGDPCSDLLLSCHSWRGLLIEPVPYCCAQLRRNFADSDRFKVIEAAVGAHDGTRDLYFVKSDARNILPDLPNWFDQLGTFDPHHIEKHLGPRILPLVERQPVLVRTYADVLTELQPDHYMLLHIDTEGYDFEILKMALAHPQLPRIIFVEHKHLSPGDLVQMRRELVNHGYRVRNCGTDFFALHRDWPK